MWNSPVGCRSGWADACATLPANRRRHPSLEQYMHLLNVELDNVSFSLNKE